MKKTLSIIIPHYKEPETTIIPLLASIESQRMVDWSRVEVIIVNDGKDVVFAPEFIQQFTLLGINYIVADWGGVSHARNVGLDNARGDYVMWCDCDDCFANCYGLKKILDYIDNEDFDMLNSTFYEETESGNVIVRNNPNNKNIDSVFAHAKVFSKQFLIDKDIRWADELKFNEDVYFIHLAQGEAKKIINNYEPFYTWCFNPSSVTRNKSVNEEKSFKCCQDTNIHLIEEFLRRGKILDAQIFLLQKLFTTYCNVTNNAWCISRSQESRDLETANIAPIYKKYGYLLKNIPVNAEKDAIKNIRTIAYDNWFVYETITFKDWLKTLDAKI